MEASAINVLKRAVTLETSGRCTESLVCYQEGIQLLLDVLKGTKEEKKKEAYRQKIKEYMDHAEQLKSRIDKEKEEGKYHEQIHIASNSSGHSYANIFQPYIDSTLTKVDVEDPYIRSTHQIYNFLRFCELLVKSKTNLKAINLVTGPEENPQSYQTQAQRLQEIKDSLKIYNIILNVEYSPTLHDREIRFDTGWVIKIGRGLDYFKAAPGKFSIGYCDSDLRQCHETTVDIFHNKHLKMKKIQTDEPS